MQAIENKHHLNKAKIRIEFRRERPESASLYLVLHQTYKQYAKPALTLAILAKYASACESDKAGGAQKTLMTYNARSVRPNKHSGNAGGRKFYGPIK